MRPFNSRDGRHIEPREHIVDFTGKNNSSKSTIFIYLQYLKGNYRSVRQLHDETGVSYDYLRSKISSWWRWRFLNRRANLPAKGKPYWSYSLAERGDDFIKYRVPLEKYNECVKRINDWSVMRKQIRAWQREREV